MVVGFFVGMLLFSLWAGWNNAGKLVGYSEMVLVTRKVVFLASGLLIFVSAGALIGNFIAK